MALVCSNRYIKDKCGEERINFKAFMYKSVFRKGENVNYHKNYAIRS